MARNELRERAGDCLRPQELHDLELLMSELVANALLHGVGAIRMTMAIDDEVINGEVIDEGGGFEAEIRQRGIDEVGGRGLAIVAAISSSWGVNEGSSHVWFEVRRKSADPDLTSPQLGEDRRPPRLP